MKLIRAVAIGGLTIALALGGAGCTGSPSEGSTPTPTENASAIACTDFADAHNEWVKVESDSGYSNSGRLEVRANLRSELDAASLEADGDVKDRMVALVDSMPNDATDMLVSKGASSLDDYAGNLDRVANACDAAGNAIELLPTDGLSPF